MAAPMSSHVLGLALVLLSLVCKGVNGQCYLMDADSDCAVCWRTTYSGHLDEIGVTQMSPCPSGIKSAWVVSPPERMVHMQEYPVSYSLTVDPNEYTVVRQGSHVPHSNIHSCIAGKGACTPFVANTPGLSTHTRSQKGSLDSEGQVTFSSTVQLVADKYILIAHSRFFVNNSQDASLPKTKYDLAIGTSRTVVRERKKCADGFFNEREDFCKPCPPGSFNSGGDPGEHICFKCKDLPGSYYQPLAGSTSCVQCPMNTKNVFASDGVNVSDCTCKPGFWSPAGEAGVECEPCPLGAECGGALQLPTTMDGFWVDRHATNGSIKGFPFTNRSSLPKIFFRCPNGEMSCKANNTCDDRYSGNMCNTCAPGLHRVLFLCLECSEGAASGWVTFFEVFAVVTLWNLVASLSRKHASVDTMLLYFQCLSLTQGFNVPWPSALNVLTTVMAVFNFNIDAVSPACAKVQWTYTESAWLSMSLPFIFGFFSCCRVLLGWLWMKRVGTRTVHGLHLSIFVVTAHEFDAFWREALSSWLELLTILYNSLCVVFFQAFYCVDLPGGYSLLRADPDVVCWTPSHRVLVAVSVAGILLFVVGMPVLLWYKLWSMKQQNALMLKHNIAVWGFLYTNFENGFWYWPIIILARRLVLCFLMVTLFDAPQFQLAIGITVTILWICLQYFARPFKSWSLDLLDSLGVLSIAFYMIGGFVFGSTDFGGQYQISSESRQLTVTVLLSSFIFTTTLGLCVLVSEIWLYYDGIYNEHVIGALSVGAWMKMSAAVSATWQNAQDLLEFINEADTGSSPEASTRAVDPQDAGAGAGAIDPSVILRVLRRAGLQLSEHTVSGAEEEWALLEAMSVFSFALLGHSSPQDSFDSKGLSLVGQPVLLSHLYLQHISTTDVARLDKLILAKYFKGYWDMDMTLSDQANPSGPPQPVESAPAASAPPARTASASSVSVMQELSHTWSSRENGLQEWKDEMVRRERTVNDKGSPLNMLLGKHKLRAWLTSLIREKDLVTMLKVCAINTWLSPFFGDNVAYGSNDYSAESEFYRDMGMGSKHVLDLLLSSVTTDAKRCMKLPDVSQWFAEQQTFRERHHGIALSEEIHFFGRPQLVHWLINRSTAEQRKILADVLVNVVVHHESRIQNSCLGYFTTIRQRRVGPVQDCDGSGDGVLAVRLEA